MRVIAFDPGYERLGVAVIERQSLPTGRQEILLYSHCVRTQKGLPFEQRLRELGSQAEALIDTWQPAAMALEEVFFSKSTSTAMQVAEVRGMLAYIAGSKRLPVHHFTPNQVKVAVTGSGRADKRAVARMVPKLIALVDKKRLDDELDAIAVGLTCLASVRLV